MSAEPPPPVRPPPRKSDDVSRSSLWISAIFHGVIILVLFVLAARQGFLGENLRKISVEMVREKPVEKPKEPEKPKPAEVENKPKPAPEPAAQAPAPQAARVVTAPPPVDSAPPPTSSSPPPVQIASFEFEGGRPTQVSGDSVQIYKSLLESYLRSNWKRPEDSAYDNFSTDIEITIDAQGQIKDSVWKSEHRDARWDNSIQAALQSARGLPNAPPAGFPRQVRIRFDVVDDVSNE